MVKKKMVDHKYFFEITNLLEQYLLRLKNYIYDGQGFDMILFTEKRRGQVSKFDLIFSAVEFDVISKKVAIKGTYDWLKQNLDPIILKRIESVIVVDTRSLFTRNLGYKIPSQDEIRELHYVQIGGAKIDHGYVINSNIVNKLVVGQALTATLIDGQIINMGIKSINSNLIISYYTGKGLRELFPRSSDPEKIKYAKELLKNSDDFLFNENYISNISFSEIRSLR